MSKISGPAAAALESLTPSQIHFLQQLPKAELHAHLNGSIPLSVLQDLAIELQSSSSKHSRLPNSAISAGLDILAKGVQLDAIEDFFSLFPSIYALTSTPESLSKAARAVLHHFLLPSENGPADCSYIEVRTTPRQTDYMTRQQYLSVVLAEVEQFSPDQAALLVSIDRRMTLDEAMECVEAAISLKEQGRRIVGMDLCGDPSKGNPEVLFPAFSRAKASGLGITLHIAETASNTTAETLSLLSLVPSRLGHATYLDTEAQAIALQHKMSIEICLTSNLLCKTVASLDAHHIRTWLQHDHPVAICTDDILPFRTSLLGEYALLMAKPPLGFGLSEEEVQRIAGMGMASRFSKQDPI